MIPLASADPATIGAVGAIVIGILTAIVSPFLNRSKNRAETESIATRTTLEVNEDLREELKEVRGENRALREQLRERDEKIDALEGRVAQLRRDVDVLEAEVTGLRGGGS